MVFIRYNWDFMERVILIKENKRLLCDDIDDFIDGKNHYYGVAIEDKFKKEEEVVLYNHEKENGFIIKVIFCTDGIKKLGLVKL